MWRRMVPGSCPLNSRPLLSWVALDNVLSVRKYTKPKTRKTEDKGGCARSGVHWHGLGVHWNGSGSIGMDWGPLFFVAHTTLAGDTVVILARMEPFLRPWAHVWPTPSNPPLERWVPWPETLLRHYRVRMPWPRVWLLAPRPEHVPLPRWCSPLAAWLG
jgi:hypothetical protein